MAVWDFRNLMYSLQDIGVVDVILPFILVFTIVFAVLEKTKILGEDEHKKPRKNFNVVVALVMGLAVVIPHVTNMYPPESDVVMIINKALPQVALIAVAIIMILITIGAFGRKWDVGESTAGVPFVILALVIVVVIFLAAADVFTRATWPRWLYFIFDPTFQAVIVAIIVFGLIIYFITKDNADDKSKKSWVDEFKKTLK